MTKTRFFAFLLGALALPAAAIERFEGDLADASGRYAIDVPAGWQPGGTLVVYSHGFSMRFPEQVEHINTAPNGALRDHFLLDRGFALAAGTYASRGWALFDIEREQRALLAEFRRRAGEPGRILLFGGSLGGLVSLRTAEAYAAQGAPVAGVFAVCPPLAGVRTWDAAVDTRLLFDAVCENNPLPTGSAALPWVIDYAEIPSNLSDTTSGGTLQSALPIANRIRQCMGFYQPAIFDTTAQLQRRAQLKSLLGLTSDDFLLTNIAYAVYPLADLIQGPDKLAGRNAFDNRFVDYGDAAINARVRRVERDPLAAVRLRAVSDLRGPFGNAKVLVVHSDRDELVVPEHVERLAVLDLPRERLALALVRQTTVEHCDFSGPELLAGIEALDAWVDGGPAPDAASLRAECERLRGAGSERCGYDPEVALATLDERIRPRRIEARTISPYHSGTWYDPLFSGEGLLIEVINGGRDAVVGWYTYPPAGAQGEQRWIAGLGRVSEDGIHLTEAREFRGARFGDFDPADIEALPWGEITLAFGGCEEPPKPGQVFPTGALRLRYTGPAGFGAGERRLLPLTQNAVDFPLCSEAGIPPLPEPASAYSGSWYRAGASGDGWALQIGRDRLAVLGWYTFDPQGRPAWLLGVGDFDADNRRVEMQVQRPRGARFGSAFDPADVQRPPWGTLRLEFTGCNTARVEWTASEAGWPDGGADLVRLTRIDGAPECTAGGDG